MSTWIVLGSSPTAAEALARAKRAHRIDGLITCNRGILIEPRPSVYALIDHEACRLFASHGREARKRGVTCVTLERPPLQLVERGIEWIDVRIQEGQPWEPFQMTGLWCVEYAIRIGRALRVLLCGMEGYSEQPAVQDYFVDDFGVKPKNYDITKTVIEPLTRTLVQKYSIVQFFAYGNLNYTVEAENWTVIAV